MCNTMYTYIYICICVSEKGWRRSSEFNVADSIWKWVSVSCSRCRVTALSPPPPPPPPRKLVPALTFDVGQPIVCSRHYWWTAAKDFLLLFFPGFKKKAERKKKQAEKQQKDQNKNSHEQAQLVLCRLCDVCWSQSEAENPVLVILVHSIRICPAVFSFSSRKPERLNTVLCYCCVYLPWMELVLAKWL